MFRVLCTSVRDRADFFRINPDWVVIIQMEFTHRTQHHYPLVSIPSRKVGISFRLTRPVSELLEPHVCRSLGHTPGRLENSGE
jgi:hypothetical protein